MRFRVGRGFARNALEAVQDQKREADQLVREILRLQRAGDETRAAEAEARLEAVRAKLAKAWEGGGLRSHSAPSEPG